MHLNIIKEYMINEYHIYGRKMCIWKDPLYLNSDFCLLRNSSYLYEFDKNCLIHLLQIKRLALKRGLSETDKWLPSELHDCASAKCFQAFFFYSSLFVVRIEYLNITSACGTAWVVNCKPEIPQNRDCQKGLCDLPRAIYRFKNIQVWEHESWTWGSHLNLL